MTRRPTLTMLAGVLALSTLGCTQHYNGSLGLGGAERSAGPRSRVMTSAEGVDVTPAPSSIEPTAADDFSQAAASAPASPDIWGPPTQQPTASRARHALGPLALYGQFDAPQAGHASPLDGSGDIVRVTFTAEGADFDPALDPTGQYIVYASTRHRDTADLYLKSVRGTAVTQLTSDPANEGWPAFSPDGQRIAFASDRSGQWDIYVMDARGGQAVQLTNDATQDIAPSWSPDGRHLVYCSYGAASGQWEMVIIDVDHPTTRRVIGHGLFPNWSPQGDRIAFQRARQRGTRWFSIWTMRVTEDDVSAPTEVAVSSNAAVITPKWSEDGRYLVFCTVIDPAADEDTRPSQADVWVVAADGTNRTKLTEGRFVNLQPVWSADNTVYFVSNRGSEGVDNIWAIQGTRAMELAGSGDRPIPPSAMVPTN